MPEGFAHGFQTLEDKSEVYYQMSETYRSEYSAGVRWDDAAFTIKWPIDTPIINDRDNNYPNWTL